MIIDAHCHIWEKKMMSAELEKVIGAVVEQFRPSDPEQIMDGSLDRLLGEMDEAGIDKTVLLALDAGHVVQDDRCAVVVIKCLVNAKSTLMVRHRFLPQAGYAQCYPKAVLSPGHFVGTLHPRGFTNCYAASRRLYRPADVPLASEHGFDTVPSPDLPQRFLAFC